MKLVKSVVFVALLAGTMVGVAYAEEPSTPSQAAAKCKSEAVSEEIPMAEMSMYMSQCLEDLGVDHADIDSVIQDASPENDDAQGNKDDG